MFKLDDSEIKAFERKLARVNKKAIPYATRSTINTLAFSTMKTAKLNARVNMIMRNKWTEQSIRVNPTKSLNINHQYAAVGSVAAYMEDQEFGAVKKRKGSKGVPIPTGYSAGQQGAQPRTKLPRKVNKLASIQLKKGKKAGQTRAQQNKLAVMQAVAEGRKFVYLDLGQRQGLFKIEGGKRKLRIRMVYDLSRPSVVIPKDPWLMPSVKHEVVKLPRVYAAALQFQLDRIK